MHVAQGLSQTNRVATLDESTPLLNRDPTQEKTDAAFQRTTLSQKKEIGSSHERNRRQGRVIIIATPRHNNSIAKNTLHHCGSFNLGGFAFINKHFGRGDI